MGRDKWLEACEYSPLTSLSNLFLTTFFFFFSGLLLFPEGHSFVRLEEKAGLWVLESSGEVPRGGWTPCSHLPLWAAVFQPAAG